MQHLACSVAGRDFVTPKPPGSRIRYGLRIKTFSPVEILMVMYLVIAMAAFPLSMMSISFGCGTSLSDVGIGYLKISRSCSP